MTICRNCGKPVLMPSELNRPGWWVHAPPNGKWYNFCNSELMYAEPLPAGCLRIIEEREKRRK